MKIDNSRGVPPPDSAQVRKAPVREEKGAGHPEDRVELTNQARIAADDTSRTARIEQLRTQVRDGTYRVEPEELAHSIVKDMLGE